LTALHLAAQRGHEEIVEVLLDLGAEKQAKTDDGRKALYIAAQYGHDHIVKVLLDSSAEITGAMGRSAQSAQSAQHIAARKGHQKVVQVLLDGGAEKDAGQVDGWTALRVAKGAVWACEGRSSPVE
jgi:hypothetical protein